MESSPRKIALILAAIMLVAALCGARPAYRALRGWRAERLAREAEAAITLEAWTDASQKAQAAYHLDPTSPAAMRVVARLYTIAGQPTAVTFWQNLRASGKATPSDRRELVRAGLRFGKWAEVKKEAFTLASEPPISPENLRLAADYCLIIGDKTNALLFSRALLKLDANPASELTL